jgi:hypothetical protein
LLSHTPSLVLDLNTFRAQHGIAGEKRVVDSFVKRV